MKIAFFYNVLPGGAKRVVFEEIKYLSQKLHEVDTYTYEDTDESYMSVSQFVRNAYKYKNNIHKNVSGLKRFLLDIKVVFCLDSLSRKIAKNIDSKNYDIVVVHPDNYTQAPYILKHLKTPSIYFCEELLRNTYEIILGVDKNLPLLNYYYEKFIRFIRRNIDKKNAQKVGMIMTASNYIKEKVNIAYKKPAVVNKLGVDSKVFVDKHHRRDDVVVFIGNKDEVTGYNFAKKVIDNKVLENKVKLKVINHKNNKLILTDSDMAELFSSSLVTVCCSYNEPFGLTPLESMACATPVLATNEGGYKETVLDGVTGYLLERDVDQFVDKIRILMKDYKLYNRLSEESVRYVKEKWTWEAHGRELVKQMKVLLKNEKYKY